MNSKIKTLLAVGLVAAFASPALAIDVEANPLASGRYVDGAPGPVLTKYGTAHAEATRTLDTRSSQEWRQFDRAVGGIR